MSLVLLLKFICLCEVPGPVEMMDEDMSHDPSLVPAGDTQGSVMDHENFSNCTTQSSEIFFARLLAISLSPNYVSSAISHNHLHPHP